MSLASVKIGNARRRAVRDPPSIASRSLAAIRRSQDKRPRLSLVCPCLGDRRIFIVRRHASLIGGFGLETAGVLNERRKLRALAKTRQSGLLKGKGKITGYLLLATACDGTLAATAQFTSLRIVCRNTLQIALGDSTSVVKALFASKAILKSPALPSRRRYLKIHPATVCETTRFFCGERRCGWQRHLAARASCNPREHFSINGIERSQYPPRRCPHMPSDSRGLRWMAQECKNPRSLTLSRVFGTTRTTWDVYLVPGTGV